MISMPKCLRLWRSVSGPHDSKGMAALIAGAPPTSKGNFVARSKVLHRQGRRIFQQVPPIRIGTYNGSTMQRLRKNWLQPKDLYGEVTSSESNAISVIQKKINKKTKKGYNLEFGAEGDSAPQESDPTTADPSLMTQQLPVVHRHPRLD